jgi:hypothetical protein
LASLISMAALRSRLRESVMTFQVFSDMAVSSPCWRLGRQRAKGTEEAADVVLRDDVEPVDVVFLLEMLSTVTLPGADGGHALRHRYLALLLQSLRAPGGGPLPSGPDPPARTGRWSRRHAAGPRLPRFAIFSATKKGMSFHVVRNILAAASRYGGGPGSRQPAARAQFQALQQARSSGSLPSIPLMAYL